MFKVTAADEKLCLELNGAWYFQSMP